MKRMMLILVVCPLLMGFAFYVPSGLRWKSVHRSGAFPVVKYKVNPALPGYVDPSSVIRAIRSAGDAWSYAGTGGQFSYSLVGQTNATMPLSVDSIPTTISVEQGLKEADNLVFSASQADVDCTGPACVFLWNLDGKDEILHFDVQINAADFSYAGVIGELSLASVLTHGFGHALGLSHCAPGEKQADCSGRLGGNAADPPTDAAMYRLVSNNVAVGADDRAGIVSLYGILTPSQQRIIGEEQTLIERSKTICNPSPCVVPEQETVPAYRLSSDEVAARSEHVARLAGSGQNNEEAVIQKNLTYQRLRENGFSVTGISAESYLLKAVDNMTGNVQKMDLPVLQASRKILAIQIQDRTFFLENLSDNYDPSYVAFVAAERNVLIQIRRRIIDEISTR